MKLLGLTLIMVGCSAFAVTNGYELKMDLSMNGKHISSPRIIVKAGEVAMITQKTDSEESFVEVVATEGEVQNHKGIMMKFIIGTIGKNGERIVVSKPQILAKEKQEVQIETGPPQVSLSVIAKRIEPRE